MRKFMLILAIVATGAGLAACGGAKKCETEPIVEQNHKLIVPPNFGKMPN